jgi:hypothetical protein
LENLNHPSAMFQTDAGRTACTRPLKCSSVALVHRRSKAPTKGLSTLNSMAFGLAVYASQCGLPQPHARLASSCWSGSTGRASHPKGSDERFQSCNLHLIPLSQALLGTIDATDVAKTDGDRISLRPIPDPWPSFFTGGLDWGLRSLVNAMSMPNRQATNGHLMGYPRRGG